MNYKIFRPTSSMAIASIIGATSLFATAFILSRAYPLHLWESWLFTSVYDTPTHLNNLSLALTNLGGPLVIIPLLLVCFSLRKFNIAARLFAVGGTAYVITGLAKEYLGRERPHELITGITPLDEFHGPGFPSGHTAFATALALTVLFYIGKKYTWLVVSWVFLVAWSRIYLGVHLPLDIVGGFAIGWFSYAVLSHLMLLDGVGTKQTKSNNDSPVSKKSSQK